MSEQNAIDLADWLKNSDRDDIDYGRSKEIDAIEATLRRLDAENAALRDESENKSKLIKLCLQTADAELIKQKGQINYLVQERDALQAKLRELEGQEPVSLQFFQDGRWKDHRVEPLSRSKEIDEAAGYKTRYLYAQPVPAAQLVGEELQKLLNQAYAKGRDDANAARDLMAQQAPVDEREAFELNYAKKWQEHSPQAKRHELSFLCSELKEMRCGEKYGDGQDYLNFKWEGWQDRAALKPAVPEGYQLVPIEPTQAMCNAMANQIIATNKGSIFGVARAYKAMLAAAKDGE